MLALWSVTPTVSLCSEAISGPTTIVLCAAERAGENLPSLNPIEFGMETTAVMHLLEAGLIANPDGLAAAFARQREIVIPASA